MLYIGVKRSLLGLIFILCLLMAYSRPSMGKWGANKVIGATVVASALAYPTWVYAGIDPALLQQYQSSGGNYRIAAPVMGKAITMKEVEKLKTIEDSFVARDIEFKTLPSGASFREFREGRPNTRAIEVGDTITVEMTVRCKKLATAKDVGGVKYWSTKSDTMANAYSWTIGDGRMPEALEEAIIGMRRGALRRVELPSVLVFKARDDNQLLLPTTDEGKRHFRRLFKTDATLIYEVLVEGIKAQPERSTLE